MDDVNVEVTAQRNRVNFIQYLNTAILTCIGIFAIMLFTTVSDIKENQSVMAAELLRIKTIQDINTVNIATLDARIKALEYYNLETLKSWIDGNYIRKPQK